MLQQTGNMSPAERAVSTLLGVALAAFTFRSASAVARLVAGGASAALLARAWAGHCGVKSTLQGHTSLSGGLADQWDRMSGNSRTGTSGLPGSPAHASSSQSVDQSVDESFPASDPPASRLPDEPPSNAEAKWAAARAAGVVE
jgi:Protein of unknown function (DUF2892)